MRNVRRLRLRFCLINGHRLPCCPRIYLLPNRSCVRPIRCTLVNLGFALRVMNPVHLVDLAGVEPASRTLFSLLHTAITFTYRQVFRAIQCCISCTRHASPQGSVNHIRLPLGVYMVLPSLSTPIKPINIQSSYGGPGGSRTRVQNAFTLKGLQQFLT